MVLFRFVAYNLGVMWECSLSVFVPLFLRDVALTNIHLTYLILTPTSAYPQPENA